MATTRGSVRNIAGTYAVTKTRPYDPYYDTFYRKSDVHRPPDTRYRVPHQITDPSGRDRVLFWHPPTEATISAPDPSYVLERRLVPKVQGTTARTLDKTDVLAPAFVDSAVQTRLRESEAQTEPWLPDTAENTKPRAWFEDEELEKLPLAERQRRLVELEALQWHKRDLQIIAIQQERLDLLMGMFQEREDAAAEKRAARVSAVVRAMEEKRLKTVQLVEARRLKVLRTLTEMRQRMSKTRGTKRDIVAQYADSGSAPYAPLRRDGRADARCWQNPAVYGARDIEIDMDGLTEIEKAHAIQQRTGLVKQAVKKRAEKQHEAMLAAVEHALMDKAGLIEKKVPTLRIAQRIEKPPPRPPTPRLEPNPNEEREQAIILLQRLLRGRALQVEMWRDLERNRQLIRELRVVEALREIEETAQTREEVEAARAAQERMTRSAVVSGAVIGEMLPFLNNQLQRKREERRLDAMMKMAENERRRREAEETGRREEELRRQAAENEAFRRVMGVNYETADAYLEAIINGSIEIAAKDLATQNARQNAEEITGFTTTPAILTGDQALIARDIVGAFIIPEINREAIRHRQRMEERFYSKAAQDAINRMRGAGETG